MHMKQAGWMSLFVGFALALASCGGGGGSGSGGRMFSLTCTLGCTSGEGGQQVSCGIVNTFQNQDIAVLFSEPVDLAWIKANANAFQVINTATALTPPGGPLIDPTNPRRLIWRPELGFDLFGTPTFGFEDGASYLIRVPGTAQGDPGPYVQSTSGKRNESRILCTITTDQGVVDPVPGAPLVDIFVTEIDSMSGLPKPFTNLDDVTGTVSLTSPITFVFKDIMNLGTVVNPTTKQAPFITVKVDPDGNLSDPTDQTSILGSYIFNVDPIKLQTTAVFTPDAGYPSAGTGFPLNPRRIVINLPVQVIDLVKNSVANGGARSFVPEVNNFGTVQLPAGGEQFTDVGNEDPRRSGADWGLTTPGRLIPGVGGGSGRMGDLVIQAGEVVTLYTSMQTASGSFDFIANPPNAEAIWFDDPVNGFPQEQVLFRNNVNLPNFHIQREDFLTYTLSQAVHELPAFEDPANPGNPTLIMSQLEFDVVDGNRLLVTSLVPGTAGENVVLSLPPPGAGNNGIISTIQLTGGVDTNSFGGVGEIGENQLLTNFDYQATPGGSPAAITSITGVFEFSHVDVKAGGTLRIIGSNPAQLLVRGSMNFASGALVEISGQSVGIHASEAPLGQLGAIAGPGGGDGGTGADRRDDANRPTLLALPNNSGNNTYDAGVVVPSGVPDAQPGIGVGGTPGLGNGVGGTRWPTTLPGSTTNLFGLGTDTNCDSEQVGAPGSGGAYSTDGGLGVGLALNPLDAQGGTNAPVPDTAGGSSVGILEPVGTLPAPKRSLGRGFLRGGAGGGGGGGNVFGTSTGGMDPNCVVAPSAIDIYRSHSGNGGGGGGGALQFSVGGLATMNGVVDASGGDGGSYDPMSQINGTATAPGGGGAGGGILLRAGILDLALSPGRLLVPGGTGGDGEFGSKGGDGGTGLVRAESVTALVADDIALAVTPTDPMDPTSQDWVSVGTWVVEDRPPESFSGAQSCWMQAPGSVFSLNFTDDVDPVNGPFGWNMDVILPVMGTPTTHAYRGSTVFGGNSPHTQWGELLNLAGVPGGSAAPLVVRFQGARTAGTLANPCTDEPETPGSQIESGSVTPWVRHPAELNQFLPAPNLIRFVIIFDASFPNFDQTLVGVTNLSILTQPD